MRRLAPSALSRRRKRLGISNPKTPAPEQSSVLGKLEPHEREAAAFWFRRITTTLLVGNGGGVIALGSYLSNTEDGAAAAVIAYPALSYFLSGVLVTVCSYTVSMLWSGFRIEAYAEYYGRMMERRKALPDTKAVKNKNKNILNSLLRESPPLIKGEGWFTVSYALLGLIQLGALAGAGWLFYAGASTVIGGAREILCENQPNNEYCAFSPSLIFPSGNSSSPTDETEGPAPLTVAGYPVIASAEFEKWGDRSSWPARITVRRDGVKQYTNGFVELIVRLTDHQLEQECFLELAQYSNNSTSPYLANPQLDRLFRHASSDHRGITLDPIVLDMTMIFTGMDDRRHSWSHRYDIQSGELIRTRQHYEVSARLLPSDQAEGGAYVLTPVSGQADATCIIMAGAYGFDLAAIVRQESNSAQ